MLSGHWDATKFTSDLENYFFVSTEVGLQHMLHVADINRVERQGLMQELEKILSMLIAIQEAKERRGPRKQYISSV